MTKPEATPRAASWADYWSSGTLHSCPGSFDGNYEGEIAAFWQARFDALPDPFEMIDLCTGNGSIPHLLSRHPRFADTSGRVVGFDLAPIDPAWPATLPAAVHARIAFHGETDATRLPCSDGSVDLVTSQFGIEYIGRPAVVEIARVLKPGGYMAAVLHHPQGLPVVIAREECLHAEWLDQVGWEAAAAAMLGPMARSSTAEGRAALQRESEAQSVRAEFDAVLQGLRARAAGSAYPDLLLEQWEQCAQIFTVAREQGLAAARQRWEEMLRLFQGARLRQRELADSAVDEDRLRAWADLLGDASPKLDVVHFADGKIAGWCFTARLAS